MTRPTSYNRNALLSYQNATAEGRVIRERPLYEWRRYSRRSSTPSRRHDRCWDQSVLDDLNFTAGAIHPLKRKRPKFLPPAVLSAIQITLGD